ncbi:MAG: hypothetical protein MUC71_03280 [Steroidobacteraceae bacterium]|jgi:hypothetical protein|nr:hypothetical protein [Steroidobacteraceae bacterium]
MSRDSLLPHGEALRHAVRWLGEQPRIDAAAIEEAARRFDLTPLEEQFLLDHFRAPPDGTGKP